MPDRWVVGDALAEHYGVLADMPPHAGSEEFAGEPACGGLLLREQGRARPVQIGIVPRPLGHAFPRSRMRGQVRVELGKRKRGVSAERPTRANVPKRNCLLQRIDIDMIDRSLRRRGIHAADPGNIAVNHEDDIRLSERRGGEGLVPLAAEIEIAVDRQVHGAGR